MKTRAFAVVTGSLALWMVVAATASASDRSFHTEANVMVELAFSLFVTR